MREGTTLRSSLIKMGSISTTCGYNTNSESSPTGFNTTNTTTMTTTTRSTTTRTITRELGHGSIGIFETIEVPIEPDEPAVPAVPARPDAPREVAERQADPAEVHSELPAVLPAELPAEIAESSTNMGDMAASMPIETSRNVGLFDFEPQTLEEFNQNLPPKTRYFDIVERLGSFKTWPVSLVQKPHEMASAGLYYSGWSDLVICPFCDINIYHWTTTDNPFSEHEEYSDNCPFVECKREEFLRAKKINQEMDYSQEGSCRICLKGDVETVFYPCMHAVSCMNCSAHLSKCPVCRIPLSATVRIYLS